MRRDASLSRRFVLAGGVALAARPAVASKLAIVPTLQTADGVTVSIRDLSPRFLDFYIAARNLAPAPRFKLWQDRYDFAAVPPTPEGDAMAQQMLDQAWPRYAAALHSIEAGAAGMQPQPLGVAVAVAGLLQAPRPIRIGVTTYVGDFETNAFTNITPDGPVVAVPLEIEETVRALLFPHEMTHAIHALTAGLAPGYERTLGRVVFEEGLAMHVVKSLHPGLPDYRYVGERAWFDAAMQDRQAIFQALRPLVDHKNAQTVFRFTMGQGATGREREAYVAGWLVVGHLLAAGQTFPTLARVREAELPELVGRTLDALISTTSRS